MNFKFFSTVPNEKDLFWQIIVFPNITVLRSPNPLDRYTAVSFEWLFWSFVIVSNDTKRQKTTGVC
jgi:hypothetical protein